MTPIDLLERIALVALGLILAVRVVDLEGTALFGLLFMAIYSAWSMRVRRRRRHPNR